MNPTPTGTIRRQPTAGSLLVLFGILLTLGTPSVGFSAEQTDLVIGEAYFMAGSFQEAVEHLSISVDKNGDQAHRALYLLGRISLLTGDFRQSKEYFERAQEHMPTGARWRAQSGIGDALYGSGQYEEAIRRYRIAKNSAGGVSSEAFVELKIALCEMALGREEKAKSRMKEAIEKISVLSSWSGKEEAFYKSLSMQGLQEKPGTAVRIYVTVGPVSGIVKGLGDLGVNSEISSSREKVGGKFFLSCGPFSDPVEAMIFAEFVKSKTSLDSEVQVR